MKTRLVLTVAASALLLGLPAASPALAQTAAPAAGQIAVPPLGFQERTLPNGLKVYTSRDTSTSNVTVQVWYRVGSKDDPERRSGFAHLFEHLMFKATQNFPDETFDRLTEDVGGNNNAFTSDDVTAYHETVPANHLERLIFAEADRLGSLVVNESVFESERDVVKEEYRQGVLASPYGRLFSLFVPATLYQDHPYRRSTIGSIEDLDAATIEDVRRFHATYYRPDNAYLIVAGNFDQARLDGWIDQYFGPLTNPDRPLPANDVREAEPTGPREATFYAPNVPLPAVVLAWPGVRYDDPDRAALTVLDGILSTGESSRLYRSLVYDQKIATQTSSNVDASQQAGSVITYAIMAEGETPEAGLASLRAEAARLRDAPVTDAELTEAKNELVAGALRERETVEDRANVLGWSLINTGGAAAADAEIAALQAVTAADIQRVARRYLTDNRSIAIRYLNADDQNPVTAQSVEVSAPVRVADLAPVGRIFELLPEADRTPIPDAGPAVDLATPAVETFTLSNGLEVYVARKPGLPLISARLGLAAGSADDGDKTGLAVLTAGLLTQGSSGRSAPEIAAEIEQLGARLGASSGPDFSNVSVNAPANVFPQALTLMADVVRRPDFAAEEVERQRDQSLDGLRVALSSPGPVAGMAAGRLVYGDAAYGAPGGGTPDSLPGLTRADVAAFHASRYRPETARLIFSGDITVAQARALAEQAFGDWRASGPAPAPRANPAGVAVAPRVVVIDQPGAGQAAVYVAMRSIDRTDADYFPLTLGNTLLGGSFTSRLNQEIRIKRGLSYGTRSNLGVRQDDGAFIASAQTRNDAAAEVADLILGEINRLSTTEPTASEMTTRQAILSGAFGDSLETVDGLGGVVANLALYDLPMSDLAAYVGRVEAITPQQVQSAFAEHLPAANASLVIVGDASKFIDAIRARHPNVEVLSLTDLDLDTAALR
ncbi:M16 family metallopeptidase [Brevundimonas sp. FT23028]|uniref:M16 family metallopeptidase n=1 Tax=Brevundimonas sp. FT23028 TaxID=3393748 RepID=UPI003B58A359